MTTLVHIMHGNVRGAMLTVLLLLSSPVTIYLLIFMSLPRFSLTVIGSTGTAARAEHPEQTSRKGEQDSEPCDAEHVVAEVAFDVVGLENGIETANQRSVDRGGHDRRDKREKGSNLNHSSY